MKCNNLFLTILLFLLLPVGMRGEENQPLDLSQDNVTISANGSYTITSSGNETSNHIVVNENLNNVNITLDKVNIKLASTYPMVINQNSQVTLTLTNENSLICNSTEYEYYSYSGLHIQSNAEVTIQGDGKLTVEGGKASRALETPGISCDNSTLTINSGTIIAQGGNYGAGINIPDNSALIINGGNITAQGGLLGAGIGSNWSTNSCGSIQITGGIVNATGGQQACGIGSGAWGKTPENIIITGGTIKVTCGNNVDAFPISTPSNIYICTVDVEMKKDNNDYTTPIVFTKGLAKTGENEFTVKGDFTLLVDFTLGSGQTLKIEEGAKLTLADGKGKITNNGGTVEVLGELVGQDKIAGSGGTVNQYYDITYNKNGGNGELPEKQTCKGGESVTISFDKTPTRTYYTFLGWDSDEDATDATYKSGGTTSITAVNNNTTLYAIWKPNEFSLKSEPVKQTLIYGTAMTDYDLSTLLSDGAVTNCGTITYAVNSTSPLPGGLSLSNGSISGTPTAATATDITSVITATAQNGFKKDISITFSVAKATPTIGNISVGSESYTYDGNARTITAPVVTGASESLGNATLKYYTSYTSADSNTPTSEENDGAASSGEAPKNAGSYIVVAGYAGSDNYNVAETKQASFSIKQKGLTVVPLANQVIYADEIPAYEVEGAVDGETPEFEGALKTDGSESEKVVVNNDLTLKAAWTKNYSFSITSNIPITVVNAAASEVEATSGDEEGANGWHTGNITITPPKDFEIALVGSVLKSGLSYQDNLLWEQEGSYTLTYSLQRISNPAMVYEHTIGVSLDKSTPYLKSETADVNRLKASFTLKDDISGIASYTYTLDGKTKTVGVENAPKELLIEITGSKGNKTMALEITDVAGHTRKYDALTFTFKDQSSVDPPYVPSEPTDPDEPSEPTVYSVTLAETEGVVFDPAAGSYPVEAGESFSFSLTVAEGFRENSQPVVKVDGIVVEPRMSDGRYRIQQVRHDITITVEGIVKDTPTANETIDNDIHITTTGNVLLIETPRALPCWLIDYNGRILCRKQLSPGTNRIDGLASGAYILHLEGKKGIPVICK